MKKAISAERNNLYFHRISRHSVYDGGRLNAEDYTSIAEKDSELLKEFVQVAGKYIK